MISIFKNSRMPLWAVRLCKFGLFVIFIVTPVLALTLIFTPIVTQKSQEYLFENYALSENFTHKDVVGIVNHMKMDNEFKPYFTVLDAESVDNLTNESFKLLNEHRTKESLLNQITIQKDKVESLGLLFLHFQISDDFLKDPKGNEPIYDLMWNFLHEEFKLSIVGICYKATYDQKFTFEWSQELRDAANKLRVTFQKIENIK